MVISEPADASQALALPQCAPTCVCCSTTRLVPRRTAAESSRAWRGCSWAPRPGRRGVQNATVSRWQKSAYCCSLDPPKECHTPSLCCMMTSTRSTRRTHSSAQPSRVWELLPENLWKFRLNLDGIPVRLVFWVRCCSTCLASASLHITIICSLNLKSEIPFMLAASVVDGVRWYQVPFFEATCFKDSMTPNEGPTCEGVPRPVQVRLRGEPWGQERGWPEDVACLPSFNILSGPLYRSFSLMVNSFVNFRNFSLGDPDLNPTPSGSLFWLHPTTGSQVHPDQDGWVCWRALGVDAGAKWCPGRCFSPLESGVFFFLNQRGHV